MNTARLLTRDVLKALGLKSPITLQRWVKLKLISPPEVGQYPGGRGRVAYWPEDIVPKGLEIRRRIRNGESIKKLSAQAKKPKAQAALPKINRKPVKPTPKSYQFHKHSIFAWDACREELSKQLWNKFAEQARKTRDDLSGTLQQVSQLLSDEELAAEAVDLARHGIQPVLVMTGKSAKVVADAVLPFYLASLKESPEPVLVLPLYAAVREAYKPVELELPEQPTLLPVKRVSQADGTEREIKINADFGIRLLDADRR